MTAARHVQRDAAELDCVEAGDNWVCQAAGNVVATQDETSSNVGFDGAYMQAVG